MIDKVGLASLGAFGGWITGNEPKWAVLGGLCGYFLGALLPGEEEEEIVTPAPTGEVQDFKLLPLVQLQPFSVDPVTPAVTIDPTMIAAGLERRAEEERLRASAAAALERLGDALVILPVQSDLPRRATQSEILSGEAYWDHSVGYWVSHYD